MSPHQDEELRFSCPVSRFAVNTLNHEKLIRALYKADVAFLINESFKPLILSRKARNRRPSTYIFHHPK